MLHNDKTPLPYSIHSCSSTHDIYHPLHISVDDPTNVNSRWSAETQSRHQAAATSSAPDTGDNNSGGPSSASVNPRASGPRGRRREYLILDLGAPAVVRSITFGNYYILHPCNLGEVKVWGGLAPGEDPGDFSVYQEGGAQLGKKVCWHGQPHLGGPKLDLLLHAELGVGAVKETFALRWQNDDGTVIPVRYLRIEPILASGPNYSVSIWYVGLAGTSGVEVMQPVLEKYEAWRNDVSLRLCLKHLRHSGHLAAHKSLLSSLTKSSTAPFIFEHPLLTELHTALVVNGDFEATASLLHDAAHTHNLFSSYLDQQSPALQCQRILEESCSDVHGNVPCARGGHQLVLDPTRRLLWLFGGFDGCHDHADLWNYDLHTERWHCVSDDTFEEQGPCARACHGLVCDTSNGDLYLLGRYAERSDRRQKKAEKARRSAARRAAESGLHPDSLPTEVEPLLCKGDFWRFDAKKRKWECISSDTHDDGGPHMIYDHAMVLDAQSRKIFVFGGKMVLDDPKEQDELSGMYVYNLVTKKWNMVFSDPAEGSSQRDGVLGRIGHSMILDKSRDCLWIFSGERHRAYFSDCWRYSLSDDTISLVVNDYTVQWQGPEAGFSQRAILDDKMDEVSVFGGLCQQPGGKATESITSAFWIWNIANSKWRKVSLPREEDGFEAPLPRFAHQFVFDPERKEYYLFGGTSSEQDDDSSRLGDFWKLTLLRPSADEALRKSLFTLRRQQFIEMSSSGKNSIAALMFLQTSLAAVTDHSNETEAKEFRACMSHLLSTPNSPSSHSRPSSRNDSSEMDGIIMTSRLLNDDDDKDVEFSNQCDINRASNATTTTTTTTNQFDRCIWDARTAVFRNNLQLFPRQQREPDQALVDLIQPFGDRDLYL